MRLRLLGLLLLSLGLASPAWGAIFYVDKNSIGGTCNNGNAGTQTSPRCTIAAGRTLLSSGDTLYVRAGTYAESIVVTAANPLPSGTSWTALTIVAGYPGETVTLTGNQGISFLPQTTGPQEQLFQYLAFKNFLVRTGGNGGIGGLGCGFVAGTNTPRMTCGAHYIRWEQIDVTDTGCNSGAGGGFGSTDYQFINVRVHDSGCNELDHAWYISAERTLLDGCEADHFTGYGIQIYDSGCGNPPGVAGYNCGEGTIIRNSSFHHNGQSGVYGGVSLGHGKNIQFYNNLVYSNVVGGLEVSFSVPDNTQIYNNVLYGNGGDGLHIDALATNTIVKNNIIMNNAHGVFDTGGTTIKDHNLCATADAFCDLAPANPQFTNPGAGDFTVAAGSPARNTGTTLTLFTTDKNGAARNQGGAWDLGPYEYNEGGPPPGPPTGNPVYVAQTGGNDSRDCLTAETIGTPLLTITKAWTCMTIPGKRMIIKAGTYVERFDTGVQAITGGNGPSFSDATTLETYGTDDVTIQLPVGADPAILFWFRNGSNDKYVILKGSAGHPLVLDGVSRANSNGLAFYPAAHHIRCEYCEVKNTAFEPVYILGASNLTFVHSLIHGAGTAGVALDGTIDGFTVQDSEVYSNGTRGIYLKTGPLTNVTIRENRIRNNGTDGLDVAATTGLLAANNLVYSNGGIGMRLRAGTAGAQIYHNSVTANSGNGLQCDAGASDVEVRNTISYQNAGGGGNNLVNSCGATATSNLTTVDPLFVAAPANLQLADGSPGINQGESLLSVTIDYAGNPRPQGPPDIGAYERDQTPQAPGGDVTVRPRALRQAGMFF